MAAFTGTNADETINTVFVSPTVTTSGGALPSDADDTIDAGGGVDSIDAGGGSDTVTGGTGNDTALLGDGDDLFTWNPGDGSDTVEGQVGADTLGFNGAGANESIDISANGSRTRLFRDVASVTMDIDGTETLHMNPLGGVDTITVNDLTGTAVTLVAVDLGGVLDGNTGDGQTDTVTVAGTNGDDVITLTLQNGALAVDGLTAETTIVNFDLTDTVQIFALGGDDVVNASAIGTNGPKLVLDGGTGADLFVGSQGNDQVLGRDGDDVALMGAGNDEFVWNPGDDNDTIEGQSGLDTLTFNGAGVSEFIDIAANGGRVRLSRDVASVTMDMNDVETIHFNALGGIDRIAVHDLSGTDIVQVDIDLAGTLGGSTGDGQVDTVVIEGTNGNDAAALSIQNGDLVLGGLENEVVIENFEAADIVQFAGLAGADTLEVDGGNGAEQITITPNGAMARISGVAPVQFSVDANGVEDILIVANGGDDTITGAIGLAALTDLTVDGGDGNDTITGGDGNDVLLGGDDNDTVNGARGDDLALLGAGDDRFGWDPGDANDTVEGQDGIDTLAFNGNGAIENIDISANGERVRFFRDVGSVTMDLNDVETIQFNALGGPDTITVNDLAGTDVTRVEIDLAGTLGGSAGDAQVDQVNALATNGADAIVVTGVTGLMGVTGLPALVTIENGEETDRLTLSGLGGNDAIDASGVASGVVGLSLLGGDGDDLIAGGGGHDQIDGGIGIDTVDYSNKAAGIQVALDGATPVTVNVGKGPEDTIANIENVRGGSGNDTLTGDGLANIFRGGLGNDSLDGGAGVDTADYRNKTAAVAVTLNGATDATATVGGVAEDTIRNIESVFGGSGADTLGGDAFANSLFGGDGDDLLKGGDGADTLSGQGGVDTADYRDKTAAVAVTLNGSANVTVTVDGVAEDTIAKIENVFGGSGADTLTGDGFANGLSGGNGDDLLKGGNGADTLNGGNDIDTADYTDKTASVAVTLNGGNFVAVKVGGVAEDTIKNIENVFGGSGADTLGGDSLANELAGGNGNDLLKGGAGADTLNGGNDTDTADYQDKTVAVVVTLNGGSFATVKVGGVAEDTIKNIENINGGSGADTLSGDSLANGLAGGGGDDLLKGGIGADTLNGGNDIDTADYRDKTAAVLVTLNGGSFVTVEVGGVAEDTIKNIENVFGGSGADTLSGDSLANGLFGGGGNDLLAGANGADLLSGQAGADTYLFNTALNAATNLDHIKDFASEDTIDLENGIFTSLTTTGTLSASAFFAAAGATSAHDSSDRIVYNTTTGALFYDADGAGGVAAVQFAVLDNHAALTNADFVVV